MTEPSTLQSGGDAPEREHVASLHERVLPWYAEHARDLPWRRPDCSPWGVFVSEVMAQQTPMVRVEPAWQRWMVRWPTPADLADDSPGEAVRAWDRLGYPRRALRLHAAARAMVDHHDGEVPSTYPDLLALPGVGPYTAAAVSSFAFGIPVPVVDTNVRRVLVRSLWGEAHAAPTLTRRESDLARCAMPEEPGEANRWNVAAMELGALVCAARRPRCEHCPIVDRCAWVAAGRPAYEGPPRRGQSWHGTDRQVRGRLLAVLRAAEGAVHRGDLTAPGSDQSQLERCLDSLVEDGLLERVAHESFRLPG